MRVFGRHAAEIVPDASDDACDLGLSKLGKGAANVAPSMFGDAEKGTNTAGQCTAEGGSAIERQKLEPAEQRRCTPDEPPASRFDVRDLTATEKGGRTCLLAVWFVPDSPLEGDGFELSLPRQRRRIASMRW